MARASILVVDDEKNILGSIARALRMEDYSVDVAGSAKIALEKIGTSSYDLILVDVQMPEMNGIEMVEKLNEMGNQVPVIVMSGHATIETAVKATRLGAKDFLEKPIGTDRLLLSLHNCLELDALKKENQELKRQSGATSPLLGGGAAMRLLVERIELAADARAPVLITGERGTGKELVAHAIHEGSARRDGPFQKLNCAAVPENLIESELFGHEAGAFTGATKQRRGKFERADGGTLFLDEVGDMPAPMQAKLLRVLQDGELERVGGGEVIAVDVRIVAATNKSLTEEIEAGRFRADLHDRLNVVPLRAPPLRERKEDIGMLAEQFLALACESNDRPRKTLSDGAAALLRSYDYPGNVRELKNLIERLVILTPGDEISEKEARLLLRLEQAERRGGYFEPDTPLRSMLESAERDLIHRALEHHQGHVTKTANSLGLERSHLYKKMKALGIRKADDNS